MRRAPAKILSVLLGVVGGWASALWFIDSVGSKPAGASGNWRVWDLASGTSSNPYALAHFLFEGRVPPAQSLFRVYSNARDDEGSKLRSDCTYKISAEALESRWWSLSVGPMDSQDRDSSSVITSEDVVRAANGAVDVAVAKQPVAGNWIRPAMSGNMVIQLVFANEGALQPADGLKLPAVKRVDC
jgi:hypothetical protein